MKKVTYLTILLFINYMAVYTQTILSPSDIAITGVISDNPDEFSFVLLTDVTTGTIINFTDAGWINTGGFWPFEGHITWTATSNLTCGTEIIVTDNSPFSASTGTITDSGTFAFSTSGDQIIAYQGTQAAPSFIYAVHFANGTGWTNATSSNTSGIPTGLTNGTNAIYLGNRDNQNYQCAVVSGTSLILAAIAVTGNWYQTNSNSGPNRPILGTCTFSCSPCNSTVTWDGSSWSGTPDGTTTAIINGNYNGVSFSCCELTVNSGFTLTVTNGTYVEVENDVIVDGSIVVETQGNFVQNNDSSTITNNGNITVNKTTAPANAWYEYTYWGSPVTNETIGNALADTNRRFLYNTQNFIDATAETANNNAAVPGQDDVDDNGDDWVSVSGGTVMTPGVGYATTQSPATFASGKSYTFTGNFNNGIITVPVYRNNTETNDNNWNLIGNPYPSAINADDFFAANTDIGAIYFWSQNTPPSSVANGNETLNFSDADYAMINGTMETAGGDGNIPARAIPSGQGFFVSYPDTATPISTSGNISQGNVVFNNAMRLATTTDNNLFFRSSNMKKQSFSSVNKLWLNLSSGSGRFNQIGIGYVNGATNNDDGLFYDATKNISIYTKSTIYSLIDDTPKKFSIQGKETSSLDANEVIKLGFYTSESNSINHTFSIDKFQGDFLTNNSIYLKDNLQNVIHNLSKSDYTFTSETGEFNTRFEIVFSNKTLSNTITNTNKNHLSIINLGSNNMQFKITNTATIKSVTIFDISGRLLYDLKGKTSIETYYLPKLKSSVYIARVILNDNTVINKKIMVK